MPLIRPPQFNVIHLFVFGHNWVTKLRVFAVLFFSVVGGIRTESGQVSFQEKLKVFLKKDSKKPNSAPLHYLLSMQTN